jgi:SPP1 gp7 family putative phage head morphogenesis protein
MPFVTNSVIISKARKKNDPTLRPVKAGLNKQEKEIYDIYIRALGGMANDMDNTNVLRAIQGAIEAGNPLDASVAFQWEEFITSLNRVVPNLANQVAASANISAKDLPKRISIESNFTAADPRAVAWAQQRAGARIAGITKESQKAVAEAISSGLKTALTRGEVVERLRNIVGLDARQARALGNFYEKNLQQLLEEGYTYEEAVEEVTKLSKQYRERLLTQRATRIARTETLAAANAGRMLSWAEADARGLLPPDSVKRWKTATDERTCPVCRPLHNVAVPWQGIFTTGDMMPPAHPNCRCTAVIVPGTFTFEKSVEKRYYRFADGEETWRNYDYKWRKIANELKRKVGKCQRCGKKSDLTVDHKKRLKDGGAKYDRKNLRVLCRACNGKMARLGTKLRKDAEPWWLAKHAPGKHDQQNHAGGRGSGGSSVPSRTFTAGEDDEIHTALKEDQGAYIETLSEEQMKSVAGYQSEGTYEDVNGFLRGEKGPISPEDEAIIGTLDGVIAGAGLQYNTTVYRGVSDTDGRFTQLKVGDTILENGYSSTSPNPAVAEAFANSTVIQGKPVVLEIDVPFGQPALASDVVSSKLFGYELIQDDPMMVEITGFTRLNEVTLPRGLKMEVTNVVDKENARYVKVKINK